MDTLYSDEIPEGKVSPARKPKAARNWRKRHDFSEFAWKLQACAGVGAARLEPYSKSSHAEMQVCGK